MERITNPEKELAIDFLSEDLQLRFEIDADAVEFLPEVSQEELETRMEKYRVLLGTTEIIADNEVVVRIKGILEMQDDEPTFYEEGVEEVSVINLPALRVFADGVRAQNPEYTDFQLVGDIHTHPVLPQNFQNGMQPWSPSLADIESVISEYETGALSNSEPFIFAIAGPDETGETQYAFYRIIMSNGEYRAVEVS